MSTVQPGIESVSTFRLVSRKILSDQIGHDPRSPYVERYWLPILGPSTTWLIRHLSWRLEHDGEGVLVQVAETAHALGLGERPGRHAPFLRAIRRACDFDLAIVTANEEGTTADVALRRRIPWLSPRLLQRLPSALAAEHTELSVPSFARTEAGEPRARQLAMTLAQIGENEHDVAAQLIAWRVDPLTARDLARRAIESVAAGCLPRLVAS